MPQGECLALFLGLLPRGRYHSAPLRRLNKWPTQLAPARPPLSAVSTTSPPLAAACWYQNADRIGWRQGPSYAATNIKSTAHHVAGRSVFAAGWARWRLEPARGI